MMFLRSRRTMTAVAAAASLVLTATAVPQSPFSPVAAQATTANKTQDTNLPLKCTIFAMGGPGYEVKFLGRVLATGFMENRDFTGNLHVTMPEQAAEGEEFEVSVSMDSLSVSHPELKRLGGSPSFEEGNTQGNKIRFAVKGDVELVGSNLPATLENGVLTVDKMMQPSKSGDTVTIAFAPLKLKLKAKKAGLVEIQTPEAYRTPDSHGGVRKNNMFYGEGIAGSVSFKTPGLRVTCLTDRFTPLGVTQVAKDAEVNEPKYDPIQVKQQDTATSKNTAQAPEGTTYAKGADAPEWATVAEDGTVTVKPDLEVEPGDYEVPIVVTYPDSSADNTVVNVTVKEKPLAEQHDPQYAEVTVKQLDEETVEAPKDIAEGATFALGEGAPNWATVAEDGTVTVKPSREVKPGDYTVPVVVSYPDQSKGDTVVNVHVKVTHTNELHDPQFGETTVEQESTATVAAPEGLPEGTKVTAGEGVPEWITVNEDGSIEAKPTLETEDKEYTVPVVVTYDDGSTDEATAKVTVTKKPDNQVYSPEFGSITVQANRSAKTPAIEGLPEGTKFALAEGAPDWASIDDKGAVQLNPGGEVDAKDYTVPVTVTYPDGTTDNAELKVTVTERAINEIHDPTYSDVTVKQGDEETAPAPTDVTEGAKFAAGEGAPEWATVNEDGSVTVKPGLEVAGGKYTVPVRVTYPDTSVDDTTVNITVTVKPTNEKYDPTYPGADVKQGGETTVAPPADVADDAEFALGEGAPDWATVNPDGTVTLKPSEDVKPGDYDVPVVITYPDRSTTTTTLKVTIKEQDKQNDNTGSTGSGDGLFGSLEGSSSITGSSPFGTFLAALFGTIAIGAGLFGLYNWARDHGYVR